MLFPTVDFGIFFLIVLIIAWLLSSQLMLHKLFLLIASYVFYGFWDWHYVPLLFGVSIFAGIVAQRIQRSDRIHVRKAWLVFGIVSCLLVLIYYKYTSFLLINLIEIWGLFKIPPTFVIDSVFLPLGISFFVFHAISLLGDVYRNKLKTPVKLMDVLLYVSFFPQLIAGPILRASQFMPQLLIKRNRNVIRTNKGLILIVMGLFKKVVIANVLATQLVDPVFAAPEIYYNSDILLAVYGYAIQIYCDFSGYTDIAIGCAFLLGYRFPRNFNLPYIATNPQDFWRRWHISLSSWLRDYLFIPMGGSRGSKWRTNANLMITMLLGGLWHGAAWTFVIWGALHGMYLIIHRMWAAFKWAPIVTMRHTFLWRVISRILLFNAVCIAWIFFRSSSFEMAFVIFERLCIPGTATLANWIVFSMLMLGFAGQYLPQCIVRKVELLLCRMPSLCCGVIFAVAIFVIELLGPSGVAPFIYFQF